MNNIEIFKSISGLVLANCYDNFPLKIKLSPSELALLLGDEYWDESLNTISDNVSDYVRKRSPAAIARPTVEWMASSGLITYESYKDGYFTNVCLTAKGLEAIESKKGFGDKLLSAAKNLAKDTLKSEAKEQLRNVFSEVLSWSIQKSPTIFQSITNILPP